MNYKGGTGKTCTVVNVAHGLTLRGKKVLIIDTDPQGSAGYHLGIIEAKKTLYNLLIANESIDDCIVKARPNLDIICGNEHIFPAQLKMATMKDKEHILEKKLADLDGYDVVLFDCAPTMNILNQNILLYANELILPVSMEYLSLVGIKQLLKNIKIINRMFKKKLAICKIVPTFFDRRNNKSQEILSSLQRVFQSGTSVSISSCVSLSEAPGAKQTIFEYDPGSKGAGDYYKLVDEVLKDGKKTI